MKVYWHLDCFSFNWPLTNTTDKGVVLYAIINERQHTVSLIITASGSVNR